MCTRHRAIIVNAGVQEGDNVLITGIGGGVALIAMQLCLARKANVYVSSGKDEKIQKAVALGAKGGVNYKNKDWPNQLLNLLEKNHGGGSVLSSVIDSGGGDIMGQVGRLLKGGGKVVVYGM
jgi:NADPH:quinone reductase-like Zn-dependent oxidoreductase